MLPFQSEDDSNPSHSEYRPSHGPAATILVILLTWVAPALSAPSPAVPAQPLPLADERKLVDRLLAEEFRRLVAQNVDPATPIDNRKYSYGAIAELGTPDAGGREGGSHRGTEARRRALRPCVTPTECFGLGLSF